MLRVRSVEGGVTFSVRVQPGARQEGIAGIYGEAVKITLAAPALEGKANDALMALLAEVLNVPKRSIVLVAGQTSRSKVVRVFGVTVEQAQATLSASSCC